MLYMDFKEPDKILWNVSGRYKVFYESSWFDDPTVVRIAEAIDKVKRLGGGLFVSEFSGEFTGLELSGGAQAVILMYLNLLDGYAVPFSWLGENCLPVLGTLDIQHDIHLFANTVPLLDEYGCEFVSSVTGERLTNHDTYIKEYYKYACKS